MDHLGSQSCLQCPFFLGRLAWRVQNVSGSFGKPLILQHVSTMTCACSGKSTLKGRQPVSSRFLDPHPGNQNHPGSPLVGSPTSWYCWSPQSLVPCPQWSPTQWPAVFFFQSADGWFDDPMTGAKHQGRLAMMVGSLFRDIAHQLCHLKSKKVNGDGNSLSMEKHLLKLWSPKYTNALII